MDGRGFSQDKLEHAIKEESALFRQYSLWLQEHMPPIFFEEVKESHAFLIAHSLMGFNLQNYFSQIFTKNTAYVLCLDSHDADLKILRHFEMYGIRNYQTFVSNTPPPFPNLKQNLRIAMVCFSESTEEKAPLNETKIQQALEIVHKKLPEASLHDLNHVLSQMNSRFIRSLNPERMAAAIEMYLRSQSRDHCQFEVKYNEDWNKSDRKIPSMQVVFAWKNAPKHGFLYKLAKMIYRHNLAMTRVNATYINPYSSSSTLVMSIGLHGIHGKAAWEETDVEDLLQELVTLKYFDSNDQIESTFVDPGLIRGNLGNLLRTIVSFVHQALVHADANLYSLPNIEEAFCRHPDLTIQLLKAFELKFSPKHHKLDQAETECDSIRGVIAHLDTGQIMNDMRRKNVFLQALNFVRFTLKTNFYRANKSSLSFRLDPAYLSELPYDRKDRFPEIPFALFFIKGMHFFGFHIRFKDLSRGGLRTVLPSRAEQAAQDRNNVFAECYNLAYTQQKKNKDIPEGGSKGVIFLEPFERMQIENEIYMRELRAAGLPETDIESKLQTYKQEMRLEYLYQAQRAYIHSLLTLVNCTDDGTLKASDVVDYYRKPEYIYLGPDENMHNVMLDWIAHYSVEAGYKPGAAFISSKPKAGINHKEFGVTSYGVNVYMIEALKFIGINPEKDRFTVKISGGPDGDVAGNQIHNLYRFFKNTAKLVALTDVSGTIYDPEGLDLQSMEELFQSGKPIRFYPREKLHEGAYLLDLQTKRDQSSYAQQTLLLKREGGKVIETWLSGSEMNHLFRHNLHQVKADVFIPGGGRPRTLNEENYLDFLDERKEPTSKIIVEGANLYLTPAARRALEKHGVIIIKDSSANKGGVICSSLEVLSILCLSEEEFLEHKDVLVHEILGIIKEKSEDEARLLLRTMQETGQFLTDISDLISERINTYTYAILDYLDTHTPTPQLQQMLDQCVLHYAPYLLSHSFRDRLFSHVPKGHRNAIIACHIASKVVYKKGLLWSPSITDVLPLLAADSSIIETNRIKNIKPL